MKRVIIIAVCLTVPALLRAGSPPQAHTSQPPPRAERAQPAAGGRINAQDGFVNGTPIHITGASCSGPGGGATLNLATNPFSTGEWIAIREVPPSMPIEVNDEHVATGNGTQVTFTYRTASYPIQRASVSIMVGGEKQGDDSGMSYPGIGQFAGRGLGEFSGTVDMRGTSVTLTSSPAVFDPRWQAFMPVIRGERFKYVIGHGVDSTHVELMAPGEAADNGTGFSFTLPSQIDYLTGVIEVTFKSAPGAGVPISLKYIAEPSRWDGERKVESVSGQSVTYTERNCTSAVAKATSGTAYAIPVLYVAPASHRQCTYDGDGGQACTPSDSNLGNTKSKPKATLAGAWQVVNRHVLTVPYMVQLADANGTGLAGPSPAADCYQPRDLSFTVLTMGGSPFDENEQEWIGEYPGSYLWFRGNAQHPGRVMLNGSGQCTSEHVATGEALRFDHTAARVDGFSIQGYGNHTHRGLGPSTISFGNFSTGFVENMICKGNEDLDPAASTECVGAWDHSTLKVGGNHTVRNANWVHAINESNLFTASPADGPTQNTNLDYSSDVRGIVMACTTMSNCQIDHLTAHLTGKGAYVVQAATEKSSLYYAERYVGSMCPDAACMDFTIDAPNITWQSSQLGGHIDGTCGNHQQGVCRIISGPAIRSYSQEDSFVKEYSQSVMADKPDIAVAGGCVEIWNAGWEKKTGSQPPVCSAIEFKSENKQFVPLTLQNAKGSSGNILELKTDAGGLATSFNAAGQISTINNVPTTGNGMGAEVYSAVSSAANSSLSPVTMFTPTTDGTFAVHFYVAQAEPGEGCTSPAKVAVNLIYNDPFSGTGQPFTFVVPLNLSGSGQPAPALSLSTGAISVANTATGSMVFRAAASAPIQYSTTYTGGTCTNRPSYRVAPVLTWF